MLRLKKNWLVAELLRVPNESIDHWLKNTTANEGYARMWPDVGDDL